MFNGSLVALITPFENGSVDEDGFQSFVEWQISEGTHGLVRGRGPRRKGEASPRTPAGLLPAASFSGAPVGTTLSLGGAGARV